MLNQLPLFTLRFVGIALPLIDGLPAYRVYAVYDFEGKLIGTALLSEEEFGA